MRLPLSFPQSCVRLGASIAVCVAALAVAQIAGEASAEPSGSRVIAPEKKAPPPATTKAAPGPVVQSLVPGVPLPDRQRQFLAMLLDAQTRYHSARTSTAKLNVRLGLQVNIQRYMDVSQDADAWIGVVHGTHETTEGDLALSISIGPNIGLSTWNNYLYDRGDLTLILRRSALFKTVRDLKVGDPIVFSASLLVYDVSDDDGIVERPSLIVRFKSVQLIPTTP